MLNSLLYNYLFTTYYQLIYMLQSHTSTAASEIEQDRFLKSLVLLWSLHWRLFTDEITLNYFQISKLNFQNNTSSFHYKYYFRAVVCDSFLH